MNNKPFEILFFLSSLLLSSCSSYYETVPLHKIDPERKEIPRKFAEAFFEKCAKKDYTPFEGFNISKKMEQLTVSDSIKQVCLQIEKNFGTVKVRELVSVHTYSRPANFMDIFNYRLQTEKAKPPRYLHIGIYRDKNFIDRPFYFSKEENYLLSKLKKYRKNTKNK